MTIDQTEPLAIRAARWRLFGHRARRRAAENVLAASFVSDADRRTAAANIEDCDRQIARVVEELQRLGVDV